MDRTVAANWFDYMVPDPHYEIVNFKHNIPPETEESGSSHLTTSTPTFRSVSKSDPSFELNTQPE